MKGGVFFFNTDVLIPLETIFRNKCLHVYSESVVTLKISSDSSVVGTINGI